MTIYRTYTIFFKIYLFEQNSWSVLSFICPVQKKMAESEFLQLLLLSRKKRIFIYSKMQVNKDRKNVRENVWRITQRKEGASNEKVKWQLPRSMAKKPKHLSFCHQQISTIFCPHSFRKCTYLRDSRKYGKKSLQP